MNIINLSPAAIIHLAEAASRADAEGRELRVCIEGHAFKYKVGGGMWSMPFYGIDDMHAPRSPQSSSRTDYIDVDR